MKQFAKEMGFEKIPTTKIKDMCFVDDDVDTHFIPISRKDFFKEHTENIMCWWDKGGNQYFEDIDELIEHYEDEWEDFCEKNNINVQTGAPLPSILPEGNPSMDKEQM